MINKLQARCYLGLGIINIGRLLAASVGGALVDRALHPIDTYHEIQKRRAISAERTLEPSLPEHEQRNTNGSATG